MASTVCVVPDGYPAEIIGYAYPWIVSPGDQVSFKVTQLCDEASTPVIELQLRYVVGFNHSARVHAPYGANDPGAGCTPSSRSPDGPSL